MSDISDRIDYFLDTNGLFRSELVRATGISESTIRSWKGAEPRAKDIYKVAQFFNVSVEFLITGKNENKEILSAEEKEIISDYRCLSEHDKTMIKSLIKAAYKSIFVERQCKNLL